MSVAPTLLRDARKKAGASQRALSAAAGTSGPTLAAYERGTKDPRTATLTRILAAAGYELDVRPRRTRNELFVDLVCDRLAHAVLSDPRLLAPAREVVDKLNSAWAGVWHVLLDAGPMAVAAVLTSTHPAARPLKADTPFAVMGIVEDDERTRLLERAREMHHAA